MSDSFDTVLGQPKVREFLRTCVRLGRISHAYLFTGPAGSNKTRAAYAFAQAILCPRDPKSERGGLCEKCDRCMQIRRGKHPDVKYYSPEGVSGYLVEQVREIVADASLSPIQAERKIYIIDRADLLGSAGANAFLKTLEEPPEDVVFILLARTRESVLPTIASRCLVVPFRHIPPSEAAGIICQNTGVPADRAQEALAACNGSISRAIEFIQAHGNERFSFRARVLSALSSLAYADDWDVLGYAVELVGLAKAPLDVVRQELEAELAKNEDFLAKSAIRQIEARNKRQVSAKSTEYLQQLTAIVRSWLRDALVVCAGTDEIVVNIDAREALEQAASKTDVASLARAIEAVERCEQALQAQVSPETCVDALLFEIREVLYAPDSASQSGVQSAKSLV